MPAETFRNLAEHNGDALRAALVDAYAWMEFLPTTDRRLFVDEFARVVTAVAKSDNYAP